ncbi:MAG TPA: hypothetical protein PLT66_05795, partial [Bacillota bacterium]|nr:hypothetical protein [Bacillota bacterium]
MAGLLYYSIPTPLMIADEDFKILMKYGCFEEYAIRFRKGASLKNYFGLKGLLKLKKLEDGDCILIEYNNTAIDIFSVVKKGRHYYFFLCSFYSLIEMRIRLYDPDFNSVVTDHYKKVCAYISEMKKEEYICPPSNTLKKANMLCASMTRCVKFEHFLFKNLKYERCVSNDMLSIFRIITSLIDPNECFIQMMDRIDKPLTAVYDVLDMTLVISALLNI